MGVGKIRLGLVFALVLSWLLLGITVFSAEEPTEPIAQNELQNLEQTGEKPDELKDTVERFLNQAQGEIPSPCDRVKESQILVYKDRIIINFEDAEWATFTDTNSMDPVIDQGANALEYVPQEASEICVGDIVSYKSVYADGVIIHRVAEIGYDEQGWYAKMKGDNNMYQDPGKVRFSQIQRVVIGIIY